MQEDVLLEARKVRDRIRSAPRGGRTVVVDIEAKRLRLSPSRLRSLIAIVDWIDDIPEPVRKNLEYLHPTKLGVLRRWWFEDPQTCREAIDRGIDNIAVLELERQYFERRRSLGTLEVVLPLHEYLNIARFPPAKLVMIAPTSGASPLTDHRAPPWEQATGVWRRRRVAALIPSASVVAMEVIARSDTSMKNRRADLLLTAFGLKQVARTVLLVCDRVDDARILLAVDLGQEFGFGPATGVYVFARVTHR